MYKLIILITLLMSLNAQAYHQLIETLFEKEVIFDGNTGIAYDDRDEDGNIILVYDEDGHPVGKESSLPRDFSRIINDTGVKLLNTGVSKDKDAQARRFQWIADRDNQLVIKTFHDLDRALADNKLGINFYIQKPYPIERIPRAQTFEQVIAGNVKNWMTEQGIKVFQLSYNEADNDRLRDHTGEFYPGKSEQYYAGGSNEDDLGLTKEGRELVRQIFKQGGVVDVSHTGRASTIEIVGMAKKMKKPVTANHIGAHELNPWHRNKIDATICYIASTGGVVGATPVKSILVPRDEEVTWRDFIRHVNYMKNLDCREHVGKRISMINHLNVALDTPLEGWELLTHDQFYVDESIKRIDRWKFLAEKMLYGAVDNESYSYTDLKKIFGGNMKRVLRDLLPRISASRIESPIARPVLRVPNMYSLVFRLDAPNFYRMTPKPAQKEIIVEIQKRNGAWGVLKKFNAGIRNSFDTGRVWFPRGTYRYKVKTTVEYEENYPMEVESHYKKFQIE